MKPLRIGVAFAITVGLFYALCTLVWVLAPVPFLAFMRDLFHGMDFTALLRPEPFSWPGFGAALVILSLWALAAGTFFAWLSDRFARTRWQTPASGSMRERLPMPGSPAPAKPDGRQIKA